MSSYITKLVGYLSSSKAYVQEIADKIAIKANRSGKSFKEYIHDDENVGHISLVVYDILPLPFKFAIRYEKFNKSFTSNFGFIRKKLFDIPAKEADHLTETINAPKPSRKRVPAKKIVIKTAPPLAEKSVKKPAVKKQVIKAVAAKKTVKKVK